MDLIHLVGGYCNIDICHADSCTFDECSGDFCSDCGINCPTHTPCPDFPLAGE